MIDEATSSLDAVNAAVIENTVLGMEGVTRIVVTHKPNADILRQYDGIIVLQRGKAIDFGHFDRLMENSEYFRSMIETENQDFLRRRSFSPALKL